MADRISRTTKTRETETRRKPWTPPSTLDAPPPPEGYTHRWIRESIMGFDDKKNLSARLREGFELVRADEFPLESKAERQEYFKGLTRDQQKAVDNDMMREQHPSMPILKPERQSRVTFGGKNASD